MWKEIEEVLEPGSLRRTERKRRGEEQRRQHMHYEWARCRTRLSFSHLWWFTVFCCWLNFLTSSPSLFFPTWPSLLSILASKLPLSAKISVYCPSHTEHNLQKFIIFFNSSWGILKLECVLQIFNPVFFFFFKIRLYSVFSLFLIEHSWFRFLHFLKFCVHELNPAAHNDVCMTLKDNGKLHRTILLFRKNSTTYTYFTEP